MSGTNPFTALFEDTESTSKKIPILNDILEDIFSFSINPDHSKSKGLLFLEEVRNVHEKDELDISLLHYALFERLFMCNENSELNSKTDKIVSHAYETRVINYLYTSYKKLQECTVLKMEDVEEIKDKIIQNVATAIIQPDLYSGQKIDSEIIEILKEAGPYYDTFFIESSKKVLVEENNNTASLSKFVESMNKLITNELIKSTLISLDYSINNYLNIMTSYETLAELFLDCCFPKRVNIGAEYAITLIGALFNLSVLPKLPGGTFDHFTDPMDQVNKVILVGFQNSKR